MDSNDWQTSTERFLKRNTARAVVGAAALLGGCAGLLTHANLTGRTVEQDIPFCDAATPFYLSPESTLTDYDAAWVEDYLCKGIAWCGWPDDTELDCAGTGSR